MTKRRALLILIFLLPLIPLSRFVTLGGVTSVPPRVHPNWDTLISGRYQEWYETYFGRHFGLFGQLVKLDSALDNALGETRFNTGLCGLRGYRGVLFQNDEVDFINRRRFDADAIAAHLEAILKAQKKLEAHGIEFRLLFVPTKMSYYAEDLPDRWKVPPGDRASSDVITEGTLDRLQNAGVNVIDARDIIADVTKRTGEPGFPREGRHLTDFVGCQILGAFAPKPFACPPGERRDARGAENDLYRCFNELGLTHRPESLLDTSMKTVPSSYKRALFVGSSFMRELETEARRLNMFDDLHLFYYNHTDTVGEWEAPRPEGEAWRKFILSRELIVMDWFAPQVEQMGFGFPEAVNTEL